MKSCENCEHAKRCSIWYEVPKITSKFGDEVTSLAIELYWIDVNNFDKKVRRIVRLVADEIYKYLLGNVGFIFRGIAGSSREDCGVYEKRDTRKQILLCPRRG